LIERTATTRIYFFGIDWNFLINPHRCCNKSHIIPPESEGEGLVRVRVRVSRREEDGMSVGGLKYWYS